MYDIHDVSYCLASVTFTKRTYCSRISRRAHSPYSLFCDIKYQVELYKRELYVQIKLLSDVMSPFPFNEYNICSDCMAILTGFTLLFSYPACHSVLLRPSRG